MGVNSGSVRARDVTFGGSGGPLLSSGGGELALTNSVLAGEGSSVTYALALFGGSVTLQGCTVKGTRVGAFI